MREVTLEEVRGAYHADILSVPFHRHLGIDFNPDAASGEPRLTLSPRPELVDDSGELSPGTLFTLADAASALELCEEVAPRALEIGKGAIFFTVAARFNLSQPASGTIGATAEVVSRLADDVGLDGASRKARVEVATKVVGADGEQLGDYSSSFYVRFIDLSRMREAFAPSSEVVRVMCR
jgi:acyl-coenzyme A thioesterase PaaI-like protein